MTDKRLEEFIHDLAEQLHDEIKRRLATFNVETRQRVIEILRERLATTPGKGADHD
jgi:DNA anti-recombination protein RmuC